MQQRHELWIERRSGLLLELGGHARDIAVGTRNRVCERGGSPQRPGP
jgi:hypothetical protein